MKAKSYVSTIRIVFFGIMLLSMFLFAFYANNLPKVRAQGGSTTTPTPTGDVSGEIVGGAPADPGEWSWQVALVGGSATDLYNGQFCGGSLVSSQWVVTAGHCVDDLSDPSQVDVVAGIYDLSNPAVGYQRRDVDQILVHPNYNGFDSDIALLHLSSPVILGGNGETRTALIPLVPSPVGDLAGINSWVTGWGNTESIPSFPDKLYEVQVPIITNALCNDPAHYNGGITSNMLCAGYDAGGKDSCQGDSGGPLVAFSGGQWKLAGVVSWGNGCADPFQPGVYTRISNFTGWVNTIIDVTFEDVPLNVPFWPYIESFYNTGITVGCSQSPRMYCPDNLVTRGEMAVFIERAMGNFAPTPSPTGMFADLPYPGLASFTPFIEEYYNDGITVGCLQSPLTYCPQNNVTRGEMAVFIERAIGNFSPTPSPTGMFSDLPYPGMESFTPFIEEFYNDGITVGCLQSPLTYCPQNYVTRGEMAVFIVRAFGIPLP